MNKSGNAMHAARSLRQEWNGDQTSLVAMKLSEEEYAEKQKMLMSKNRDTARMDMYFDMKQDQLNRKRNKIAEAQEKLKSEQAIVEEQMENVQQLQKSVDEQKQHNISNEVKYNQLLQQAQNEISTIQADRYRLDQLRLEYEQNVQNILKEKAAWLSEKQTMQLQSNENAQLQHRLSEKAKHLDTRQELLDMHSAELKTQSSEIKMDRQRMDRALLDLQAKQELIDQQLQERRALQDNQAKQQLDTHRSVLELRSMQTEEFATRLHLAGQLVDSKHAANHRRAFELETQARQLKLDQASLKHTKADITVSEKRLQAQLAQVARQKSELELRQQTVLQQERKNQSFAMEVEAQHKSNLIVTKPKPFSNQQPDDPPSSAKSSKPKRLSTRSRKPNVHPKTH